MRLACLRIVCRALPMLQQHPVKTAFDAEPFICQTMTKLPNTIM
jgi:hypothetical protein